MHTQTNTASLQSLLNPQQIDRAEEILRSCVHCGFCLATCPTYQLLGSELDSPRGRIYQIKQLMEGATPTRITQQHLDRCLTCRNCETTCPSGIRFSELLDIGRQITERSVRRPMGEQLLRNLLNRLIPSRWNSSIFRLGQWLQIPLAKKLPTLPLRNPATLSATEEAGHLIFFEGCVQNGLAPATNQVLKQILQQLGYTIHQPETAGCCGALSHHMTRPDAAEPLVDQNIRHWLPLIEQHQAKIVIAASGCGSMVQEYDQIRPDNPAAKQVSEAVVDPAELLLPYLKKLAARPESPKSIAYHPPCSQQHGLRTDSIVEQLLQKLDFKLQPVADRHLCCGAAGSYSILQSEISNQLRKNKLERLEAQQPEMIATANIGCQHHLQQDSSVPVVHWIELLEVKRSP